MLNKPKPCGGKKLPSSAKSVVDFDYNGNGKRISKTSSGSGEYYLNNYLGRELAIYSAMADRNKVTGELKEVNILGNGLIGKVIIDNSSKYVNEQLARHKNFNNRVNIILI